MPAIESKPIEQATTPIDLEPYEVDNAVDANIEAKLAEQARVLRLNELKV